MCDKVKDIFNIRIELCSGRVIEKLGTVYDADELMTKYGSTVIKTVLERVEVRKVEHFPD